MWVAMHAVEGSICSEAPAKRKTEVGRCYRGLVQDVRLFVAIDSLPEPLRLAVREAIK